MGHPCRLVPRATSCLRKARCCQHHGRAGVGHRCRANCRIRPRKTCVTEDDASLSPLEHLVLQQSPEPSQYMSLCRCRGSHGTCYQDPSPPAPLSVLCRANASGCTRQTRPPAQSSRHHRALIEALDHGEPNQTVQHLSLSIPDGTGRRMVFRTTDPSLCRCADEVPPR